jgi:hypothetical protein
MADNKISSVGLQATFSPSLKRPNLPRSEAATLIGAAGWRQHPLLSKPMDTQRKGCKWVYGVLCKCYAIGVPKTGLSEADNGPEKAHLIISTRLASVRAPSPLTQVNVAVNQVVDSN